MLSIANNKFIQIYTKTLTHLPYRRSIHPISRREHPVNRSILVSALRKGKLFTEVFFYVHLGLDVIGVLQQREAHELVLAPMTVS